MRKLTILAVIFALLLVTATPSFAQDNPGTLVEIAASNEDFSILVQAVQAADPSIAEALSSEGELTVFAPTNAAFETLLAEMEMSAGDLLANTELLNQVLLYHVVAGKVMSADIVEMMGENASPVFPETLQGSRLGVTTDGENIFVNDAQVVAADIAASNGVIHVIDSVLLPPGNIADIVIEKAGMTEDAEFTMLLAAVQAADPAVLEALTNPDATLTVFAPTDAAFTAALEALGVSAEDLLADTELLTNVLLYHVVGAELYSTDVAAALEAGEGEASVDSLLEGDPLSVTATDEGIFVDGAQVVATDIIAANGVIHVIDAVILPNGE